MTVALCMIVRNEAATLPRLFASVRDHIDRAVIVDTGSTDDTLGVIRRELHDHGIPVEMHRAIWRDFGTNRAEALELARGSADYLLLADADFEYTIEPGAFDNLEHDAYFVTIHEGEMAYGYAGLLRANREWRYEGVTHEALVLDGCTTAKAPGVTIQHHCDGGSRIDKFERDLELLVGLDDPRSIYYRAQTLACLGRPEEAAAHYLTRATMGGWDEEVYHSLYRAGVLLDDIPTLLRAWSHRPTRLEALYEAAHRLRSADAHEAAYALLSRTEAGSAPDDLLFVEPYVYDFALEFELALAAQNTGRVDEAAAIYRDLEHTAELPAAYRASIACNLASIEGH